MDVRKYNRRKKNYNTQIREIIQKSSYVRLKINRTPSFKIK